MTDSMKGQTQALRKTFAYLVDEAHGPLLDAVLARVVGVARKGKTVRLSFGPKRELIATAPAPADASTGWPSAFRQAVGQHALLQFPDDGGWGLVLGDHGNFEGDESLRSPLRDYSDWWVYHPSQRGADGEPLLSFVSHEGGGLARPVGVSASVMFVRRLAELLEVGPLPALAEPRWPGGVEAVEAAVGPELPESHVYPLDNKGKVAARVQVLRFTPDGRHLVGGAEDATLSLWSCETRKRVARWKPPVADRKEVRPGQFKLGPNGFLDFEDLAISPDGAFAATAHRDEGVRLWTLDPLALVGRGEGRPSCYVVGFSASGQVLAKVGRHVWRWKAGGLALEVGGDRYEEGSTELAAFSPDGSLVAFRSDDLEVTVLDTATHAQVAVLDVEHPTKYLNTLQAITFSRDGRQVITGDTVGHVRVFDARTGAAVAAYRRHESRQGRVKGCGQGEVLVVAYDEDGIDVWSPGQAKLIGTLPEDAFGAPADVVALGPDGRSFAVAGRDNQLALVKVP